MVHQRDIVEVDFSMDQGGKHPGIVISNNLVQESEGAFVCVMMTSQSYDDEFSFIITNDMLTRPSNKEHSEARCHLISWIPLEQINPKPYNSQLRIEPFKSLIKKITETTFSTNEL